MENHETKAEDYSCSECATTFTLRRNLERHMCEHQEEKESEEFKCHLCTTSYNRRDNLLKHKRVEHNQDPRKTILPGVNDDLNTHQCFVCNKNFKQRFTLDRHLETIHFQNSDVLFQCTTCSKSFRRKDKLQVYEKTHLLVTPKIIIPICRKEFKSKMA